MPPWAHGARFGGADGLGEVLGYQGCIACVYSINGDWCVSLGLRIKSNMRTFKALTLISLAVLTSGVSPTGEGGFIGSIYIYI